MLILLFLFVTLFSKIISCPPKEKLYPCSCEQSDYSKFIRCENIFNDADLLNAVYALRGVEDIYSFTIEDSVLHYIPHDLFKGVQLVELEFLTSSILQFSDTDVALEGLEDSLEILTISDCSFMNEWDWSYLRNMKMLMRIDTVGGDLLSIDETVKELSSFNLTDINFSRNKISYVYDYAFSNFTELQFLALGNNLIKEVKRSMLPNPAPNLLTIDLGYNEIARLPEDFFQNMPSLVTVSIAGNKILTLNEQVFSPIWGQLENFQAMSNPLRCDCRMSWILEKRMPPDMRAVCYLPNSLRGKNLAYLTSKNLWC